MAATIEQTNANGLGYTLENVGTNVLRYGLVIILLWVGSLKFTAYEAEGIKGLVENSPLMSWMLHITSIYGVAAFIGVTEIMTGILIATRSFAPKISAIGSILGIITFLTTLTFVFTTPGVWQTGYGFTFTSPMPGQFLAKDIILLGASIWTAGEALRASMTNKFVVRERI